MRMSDKGQPSMSSEQSTPRVKREFKLLHLWLIMGFFAVVVGHLLPPVAKFERPVFSIPGFAAESLLLLPVAMPFVILKLSRARHPGTPCFAPPDTREHFWCHLQAEIKEAGVFTWMAYVLVGAGIIALRYR